MSFFSQKPKTSAQKAQKAQLGIMARLAGCAYLIYVVIQLLQTAPEDDKLSPTLKIVISVFFLCAAAVVIFITVLEFIRNVKDGRYKTSAYTDDIIETYASHEASKFPIDGDGNPDSSEQAPEETENNPEGGTEAPEDNTAESTGAANETDVNPNSANENTDENHESQN